MIIPTRLLSLRLHFNKLNLRSFSAYTGKEIKTEDLVKKDDSWVIEETNFCLGKVAKIRFKDTDDLARRTLHLMDTQLSKMHTRLRDGTCIPYMSLSLHQVVDRPCPMHVFIEQPLLKWTWDECYDEAYEDV